MLRRVFLFLVFVFSATSINADPVSSGFFNFNGHVGAFVASFSGSGFGVGGSGNTFYANTNAIYTYMANAGTVINLSGSPFITYDDFNIGTVFQNGVSYSILDQHVTFECVVTAGNVVVPISSDDNITLTTTFSIAHGSLHGGAVNVSFIGSGIVTLHLTRGGTDSAGNGTYSFQSVTYGFVPVPEPASISLMALGLAACVLRLGSIVSARR